jgi:hypothetical protein
MFVTLHSISSKLQLGVGEEWALPILSPPPRNMKLLEIILYVL